MSQLIKIIPGSKGKFARNFGPGFLLAAMCIGVSHLVQATRAGAEYGFSLAWLVIFACLIKYPVVRFGSDYAAATGQTLIDAYEKQGHWIIRVFALLLSIDMFVATPAITLVTAGIIKYIFKTNLSDLVTVSLILVTCYGILTLGKYKLFEGLTKIFVLLFSVLTIVAVLMVIPQMQWNEARVINEIEYDKPTLLFMIAVAGWMPTAVSASVIQSMWVCAKNESASAPIEPKITRYDFNLGFLITIILALCFVNLGAVLMYSNNIETASNSAAFAGQLINLFTDSIGEFAYFLIASTTLIVMISTVLAILDGFTRTADKVIKRLTDKQNGNYIKLLNYPSILLTQIIGSILILFLFHNSFKAFIDLSASLAFITAPFIAFFNHRAMLSKAVPVHLQPTSFMHIWSILGILFLSGFALSYIYLKIG